MAMLLYFTKGVMLVMEAFLTVIGAFFTQAVTWFTDILNICTTEPALIIMVFAMPIVGFSVGLLSRLIRL